MKIEAFATLQAVLRHGTFAAAAAQMNVTPSAVSMQMKQLERYLGRPLFDRSGLQARPTRLARDVAGLMQGPLHGLEALRMSHHVAVEGSVNLGVIESLQPVVLPGTLRRLRELHPRLDVRPTRGRSSTLTAAVKAGELDAAIVAQPPQGGSSRLIWHPVMQRELVLVAPPHAPDAPPATLFRQYDWIRYDRGTVSGALAAHYVATHIGDIRSALEFDSVPAIVAMVSSGLGLSVLQIVDPRALQHYPVRIVRLGRAAPILQFAMVARKADEDSRLLGAVRDAIRAAVDAGHLAQAAESAVPRLPRERRPARARR